MTDFDEAVRVVSQLSALDRLRLLERLASLLQRDLSDVEFTETSTPAQKKSFAELAAWLEANPPEEPWGDLDADEDAADYVHRMRHA